MEFKVVGNLESTEVTVLVTGIDRNGTPNNLRLGKNYHKRIPGGNEDVKVKFSKSNFMRASLGT